MNKGARILLADDEEDFLRYTATLFEKEGYRCDSVTDTSAAVERLKNRRYDAVISDIRMPGNANLKVARETHRLQTGVPVILITAYPSVDTAIPAVSLPVKAYIEKPIEFRDLLSTVGGAIMESRRLQQTSVCTPDHCGRLGWFVGMLKGIAGELRASRSAFQSRRLGRLRLKIEETVEELERGLH